MTSNRNLFLNFFGFGSLAVAGLAINLILFLQYDAETVGKFNIVYAVYKIGSQVSICGLHFGVLRDISDKRVRSAPIITSYLLLALLHGALFSFLVFSFSGSLGEVFRSEGLKGFFVTIAPAFLFINLNKIFFWALNGLEKMHVFGIFQSMRGLFILAFTVFFGFYEINPALLPLNFLLTELFLFVLLFGYFSRKRLISMPVFTDIGMRYVFGFKSSLNGLLTEANIKIDTIVVGLYLGDKLTGVYSLFATFGEGLCVVVNLLRNFVNPKLAGAKDLTFSILRRLFVMNQRKFSALIIISSILGFIILFLYNEIFLEDNLISDHLGVILILFSGPMLFHKFLVYDNILLYRGFPIQQSAYSGIVLVSNVSLNILTIPLFGLYGAALSTLASIVVGMLSHFYLTQRKLGFNLASLLFLRSRRLRDDST